MAAAFSASTYSVAPGRPRARMWPRPATVVLAAAVFAVLRTSWGPVGDAALGDASGAPRAPRTEWLPLLTVCWLVGSAVFQSNRELSRGSLTQQKPIRSLV